MLSRNLVLILSMGLSAAIGLWGVFFPEQLTNAAVALTSGALEHLDWLFMLACTYSVIPAIFKFIAIPLLWNYQLTEDKVKEIQADMAQKAPSAA